MYCDASVANQNVVNRTTLKIEVAAYSGGHTYLSKLRPGWFGREELLYIRAFA